MRREYGYALADTLGVAIEGFEPQNLHGKGQFQIAGLPISYTVDVICGFGTSAELGVAAHLKGDLFLVLAASGPNHGVNLQLTLVSARGLGLTVFQTKKLLKTLSSYADVPVLLKDGVAAQFTARAGQAEWTQL